MRPAVDTRPLDPYTPHPMKPKIFASLAALALCVGAWLFFSRDTRPNVMVILIDTLRADHLGAYGYSRPTSPHLDQLAKENTRFDYAVTACPWTPPSVASIFSGLYPSSHGWMPPNDRSSLKNDSTGLAPELQTVAEVLSAAGYFTGAVSSNPWISPEFNYDQGFEV